MKKTRVIALSVIGLLTTWISEAQQPNNKNVKIDLPQAIEIALSDNPTIKIADLEIQRQDYVRKETIGNLLPQLNATGGYNRSIVKTTMHAGNQKFSFEPDNTITGSVSLAIPLFAPAVYRTLKLNDEQMRAAVESARASKVTLVSEVKKSFYNILVAEQSLEVLINSQSNIQQTVDQTRVMFNNGMASEYDLITAEVQLSNLRPTILQTQQSIETAKLMLKMLLSLPSDVALQLEGKLTDFSSRVASAQSDLNTDYTNNTDLRALDIQQKILERQYAVSRTQRMPTLSAVSNFQMMGRDKISLNLGSTDGATKKQFELQTPLSAGLQLSIPIFAGLTKANREKQIKNNIEQIKLQRDYLSESVNVQLKNAITATMTAREQMYANEKTVEQATKAYSIADTRYRAGAGTILELNTAELSLTQAKLNYSQAIYDYLSADADYTKILGEQ